MPTTTVALVIFIFFLIPGFICDSIIGRRYARAKREPTEAILNILLLTIISYIVSSFIIYFSFRDSISVGIIKYVKEYLVFSWFIGVVVVVVIPVLIALLLMWLNRRFDLENWINGVLGIQHSSIPKSWDYIFSRGASYLILVTLKDGTKFGGLWSQNSFASSYPAEEDLYLEVLYGLEDNGSFGDPVPLSKGAVLKGSEIQSLELFDVVQGGQNEQQAIEPSDTGDAEQLQ